MLQLVEVPSPSGWASVMGHAEAWGLIPRAIEGFSLGKQHWDDPEGWDGEGGGKGGFRMVNTCTPIADSCQCMAKTTTIL